LVVYFYKNNPDPDKKRVLDEVYLFYSNIYRDCITFVLQLLFYINPSGISFILVVL